MQHAFTVILLVSISTNMWLLHQYGYSVGVAEYEDSSVALAVSIPVIAGGAEINALAGLDLGGSRSSRTTLPRQRQRPACRADAPTIVSQTVRKGLNNQRMWIVQDIAAAAIMGRGVNVQLPTMLYSRQGCHYRNSCKGGYALNVPLWDVYDKNKTLRLLREFGVCVVEPQSISESTNNDTRTSVTPQLVPGYWPMTTSQLRHMVDDQNGSLLRADNNNAGLWSIGAAHQQICCTKLVPDSIEGAHLLRQINFAFQTSVSMKEVALSVDRAVKMKIIEALQPVPVPNTLSSSSYSSSSSSYYVALHWRNDGDFTQNTKHQLNSTAYIMATARALGDMRTTLGSALSKNDTNTDIDMPLHVVVLGDLDSTVLKNIETAVHAVSAGSSLDSLPPVNKFVFHSKTSLLASQHINLADISPSEDVRGQVDFEIGFSAPAFVGSPFSSFSALIAFQRSYQQIQSSQSRQMAMIDVDTSDRLGAVQELLFPYNHRVSNNPCADIIRQFEPFRALLSGCAHKAVGRHTTL
jgi:hypothetical protein